MSHRTVDSPVLVVGCGPVGMACALLLARQGVRSTILERRTTPSCGQSRAITVQRDVLALFDRLGIVDEILADGASWSLGRTYAGDRELLQLRFPARGGEVYPAFVNFPQFRTEELLYAAARATGLVTVLHGRTFQELEQRPDSVLVKAEGPDGPETHTGGYLVAADGIGSRARRQLGIAYDGWQTSGRFLVCDFAAELPFARERRLWFGPPFYPDGIVLMHAFGDNRWRIDWQIEPDADEARWLAPQRLQELLRDALGDHRFDVLRANTYTFQQRRAERFRDGRVFLAGDAAHVVSPFGARGMNSGLEDAENLAWKLAFVLDGRADERLLDTYHAERAAAAAHHVEVTGATMQFMTPSSPEGLARRDAVLAAAASDPARLPEVDSGRLYEPYAYDPSPFTGHLDAHGNPLPAPDTEDQAVPGAPALDGHCSTGEGPTTLRTLLGGDVSLLAVPAAGGSAAAVARRLAEVTAVPPGRRFVLTAPGEAVPAVPGATAVVDDSGVLTAAYAGGADQLFLVRPDCYLGVRAELPATPEGAAALGDRALAMVLGTATP